MLLRAPLAVLLLALPTCYGLSTSNLAAYKTQGHFRIGSRRYGWVQDTDGEWQWEEDDPNFAPPAAKVAIDTTATATPKLPAGKLKPKQSLGQNYLKDPNTVAKMIRAFHEDATRDGKPLNHIVELGPGAGALTDRLVDNYGTDILECVEIDQRAVEILNERHPSLLVHHADVLQVNYPEMAEEAGQPLVVIGNLPYYITSQILFALADASHYGSVDCATVTMQWEVAQRMVAPTSCKVCNFVRTFAPCCGMLTLTSNCFVVNL